jgi:hypothetical protein
MGEKKQLCDNKQKWIPLPPKNNSPAILCKKRIFAYGDSSFSTSMKEEFPAPTRHITDAIKKMSKDRQGKTVFVYITEAFTSKAYNQCKAKDFTNTILAGSKQKVHVDLKCNSL